MEFDWTSPPFDVSEIPPGEIQETFEDPFSLRIVPDEEPFTAHARYFCLGKTLSGKGLFSIYRSNGNLTRVIFSRPFTEEEEHFYERKKQENLG